ncbi:hypothetical protein C1646_695493 [Rhizophagus diaphanus]|nr:hypothetical protein C1646_695493 [Rhizophagus diaphanus] [Rhizophagus sp. MUCL 43196]
MFTIFNILFNIERDFVLYFPVLIIEYVELVRTKNLCIVPMKSNHYFFIRALKS